MLIVAFGGGVNSSAMIIGLFRRKIYPDWILFADTQGEKPETYAHVDAMEKWVMGQGYYGIIRLRKDSKYESLEAECLERKTLPSIVFGWRSCSDKWKQEPQRKWLNHNDRAIAVWNGGGKVTKAIGFGIDEMRRAKPFEDDKYVNWYPLIEWGWDRTACIEAIKAEGLAVPIKSACFYCPASRKVDVQELRQMHPELYARAVAMERNAAPNMNVVKGLGRHWSWEELPEVALETVEQTCMCFDGDGGEEGAKT